MSRRDVSVLGRELTRVLDREDQIAEALRTIHQDLSFFFACAGSVSREDMASMIRAAQSRVDKVQGLLWPETEPEEAER